MRTRKALPQGGGFCYSPGGIIHPAPFLCQARFCRPANKSRQTKSIKLAKSEAMGFYLPGFGQLKSMFVKMKASSSELQQLQGALDILFTLREEFAQWAEEAQDESKQEALENVLAHVENIEQLAGSRAEIDQCRRDMFRADVMLPAVVPLVAPTDVPNFPNAANPGSRD
jgi:hypothetical protein